MTAGRTEPGHGGPGAAPPGGLDPLLAVEAAIARLLFWGALIGIGVILLGLLLHAAQGGLAADAASLDRLAHGGDEVHPAAVFRSLGEIAGGLARRPPDPLALAALGLLLLVATPVLGVALAVVGFLQVRDRRYVLISSLVLGILLVSFFVGGGG